MSNLDGTPMCHGRPTMTEPKKPMSDAERRRIADSVGLAMFYVEGRHLDDESMPDAEVPKWLPGWVVPWWDGLMEKLAEVFHGDEAEMEERWPIEYLRLRLMRALAESRAREQDANEHAADFGADAQRLERERDGLKGKVEAALTTAHDYGQTDGDHHKAWVIDQMVRALLGDQYDAWIAEYVGHGEYFWDWGVAP